MESISYTLCLPSWSYCCRVQEVHPLTPAGEGKIWIRLLEPGHSSSARRPRTHAEQGAATTGQGVRGPYWGWAGEAREAGDTGPALSLWPVEAWLKSEPGSPLTLYLHSYSCPSSGSLFHPRLWLA